LGSHARRLTRPLILKRFDFLPTFEHYDVPALVRQIAEAGVESPVDTRDTSFYLSRVELRPSDRPGMSRWRQRLFLVTALISAEPADYFRLPRERTITLGAEIEL
jgi:KUP system potassium uptake protein